MHLISWEKEKSSFNVASINSCQASHHVWTLSDFCWFFFFFLLSGEMKLSLLPPWLILSFSFPWENQFDLGSVDIFIFSVWFFCHFAFSISCWLFWSFSFPLFFFLSSSSSYQPPLPLCHTNTPLIYYSTYLSTFHVAFKIGRECFYSFSHAYTHIDIIITL